MKTKVKICCISSLKEAQLAISYGADALGLVGHMPSGPGIISDELIFEIAASAPDPIETFLLTSELTAGNIIAHHKRAATSTIQLVDNIDTKAYPLIRASIPGVKLVQVIHVLDENSIKEAIKTAPYVDYILLDSGNPNLSVKKLGGTGKTHNWNLSRKIREEIDTPLFLAGGLYAGNVRQAIETVQPHGVDLCNGVRTNGRLDERKLETFMNKI